jgi:hypothetical protein
MLTPSVVTVDITADRTVVMHRADDDGESTQIVRPHHPFSGSMAGPGRFAPPIAIP